MLALEVSYFNVAHAMHVYICSSTSERWQPCAGFKVKQPADMNRRHEGCPPLDCSVAVVQQHAVGSSEKDSLFLMSSGHGDLVRPLQHLPEPHPTLHIACLQKMNPSFEGQTSDQPGVAGRDEI